MVIDRVTGARVQGSAGSMMGNVAGARLKRVAQWDGSLDRPE